MNNQTNDSLSGQAIDDIIRIVTENPNGWLRWIVARQIKWHLWSSAYDRSTRPDWQCLCGERVHHLDAVGSAQDTLPDDEEDSICDQCLVVWAAIML